MRRNYLVNVNDAKYAPNAVSKCGDLKWQLEDDVTLSVRQCNKEHVTLADGPQIKSVLMTFHLISGY